jgi:hypothetical protein
MLMRESEAADLRSKKGKYSSIKTGLGSFIVDAHQPRPSKGRFKHMKYIGRGPRVYGLAPRKEGRNLLVEEFMATQKMHDHPDRLFWYKKNLTTRGRWDRLYKFDNPEPKTYHRRIKVSQLSEELGFIGMKLKVPERREVLEFPCPNESANPGPSYCDRGFQNKKDAWPTARAVAYRVLNDIEHKRPSNILVGVGARPKDMDYRDDLIEGEKPARMILMPDAHEGIIGGIFCKPLMECLKLVQGPLAIGAGFQHGHAQQMASKMKGFAEYRCLDFSGYDERVYRWAVNTAFDVIKTAYAPETRDERRRLHNILDWCRDKFLSPYIVTPEGFVYRKHQGTTTGSVWTTLVNSVVNYIYLNEALTRAGHGRKGRFCTWVLGDDSVIACKQQMTSTFWNKFDRIITDKMQLKLSTSQNVLTTFFNSSSDDDTDCVQFLGKRWNRFDEPIRGYDESVRDCLVPEDFITDPIAACTAVSGIYLDNPFNERFCGFVEAFFEWVMQRRVVINGVVNVIGALISREIIGSTAADAYNLYYMKPWEECMQVSFFKPSRQVINLKWGECNVKVKTSKLGPTSLKNLLAARNIEHQARLLRAMEQDGSVVNISTNARRLPVKSTSGGQAHRLVDKFFERMKTIRGALQGFLPKRG